MTKSAVLPSSLPTNTTTNQSKLNVAQPGTKPKTPKTGQKTKNGKSTLPPSAEIGPIFCPGTTDDDRIVALFEEHSTNKAAFEIARPHLTQVMNTILEGAKTNGTNSQAMRNTLFRILGIPWTANGRPDDVPGGSSADELADRMSRAISRRTAHLGRVSVTVTMDNPRERAESLTIEGQARKIQDHLPLPATRSQPD